MKRIFANLVAQNKRVVALHNELQAIIEAGSPFEPLIKKKQELNSAVTSLHKLVEDLENKGLQIKSIEQGLLDFPSRRFDEEVWLCWKEGENEIKFWHGKDEGFMGRKPLESTGIIEP